MFNKSMWTSNVRVPGSAAPARNTTPLPDEEQIRRIIESYAIADNDPDVQAVAEQASAMKPARNNSLYNNNASSQVYNGYSTITTFVTALSSSPVTTAKTVQIKLSQLIPPDVITAMADLGAYQFTIDDLKIAQMMTPNSSNVSGIMETSILYADETTRYVQRLDEEQAVDLEIELAPLPIAVDLNTVVGKITFHLFDGQVFSGPHAHQTSVEQLKVYDFISVQVQFDLNTIVAERNKAVKAALAQIETAKGKAMESDKMAKK